MEQTGMKEQDHVTGSEAAIVVSDVKKVYKLYDKPSDRMKEAFGLNKKQHKLHYALNGVSMEIRQGETVGIIGTNGSGKSTLLKIITGVLHQTEGTVTVNGPISALLELGAGFNMEYNGIENVYLNGTMMGFSEKEIEQKLPAILEFADIGDYVTQPVKTYSSGMFVRLAFAVAINIDPEILIVDEALSVGDVFFQAKCYHKFEEFKRMGKTIVFVSHDLSSISKYCDRVFLLNKGNLLGEGSPKEMIDIYKQGLETSSIVKGSEFTIHMQVAVKEAIKAPIFAFSFKNILGVEITGTNTMLEKAFVESVEPGTVKEVTFRQKMSLQGGEYLLSFGVTGFEGNEFKVYHRLYDALHVTVVSDKNTVGYYDMDSQIEVKDHLKNGTDQTEQS